MPMAEKNCPRLTEGALQYFAEHFLLLRLQFFPARSQIKNVNRFLAFRIDQRYLNVAVEPRQRRSHVVEQSRAILRHNFEQRAVRGRRIIEADSGRYGDLRRTSPAGRFAALQQWLERRFSAEDIAQACL